MKKILSIKVEHHIDEFRDHSHIGEWTDEHDDYHFDRREGKMLKTLERDPNYTVPDKGHEYRFFKPYAGGEKPGTSRYIRYGKQDLARMEELERGDWHFIGVGAVARVKLRGDLVQSITSGGLWGIESDSENGHIKEVEQEELSELKRELVAVGFTEGEIDAVEVEEVDR